MSLVTRLQQLALVAAIGSMSIPAFADEPVRGGTLRMIAQPEPPTLMLGLNQQGPTQFVAGKIYEGLLRYDQELQPMPGLARDWSVSDDGLEYTFHLQEGVLWHDGEPFTSADVVFTMEEFLSEVHPRARGVLAHVEEIEAPDEHTVIFRLKAPFAAFIQSFEVSSAPMIPAHLYQGTDFRDNPANETPIGTGPFKLERWEQGSYIRLTRNEDYWKEGKPYLDGILFNIVPDAASRAVAFETGRVDVLRGGDIEYFDVARLEQMPDVEVTTEGWEFLSPTIWMQFNLRNEPLDDPRFRQAIWHAVNRDFIVDSIWSGYGKVAKGPVNSASPFFDDSLPDVEYDPERAIELLDEMGLEPNRRGVRATIRFLALPYTETYIRMGEYIRQQLQQVGIELDVTQTDVGGWAQTLGQWDYDMTINLLFQYGDPALGIQRAYVSSNLVKGSPSANVSGLDDPAIDELLTRAATESDPEERFRLYSEFQHEIVDNAYFGYLIEAHFPTVYRNNVRNLVNSAIGLNDNMAEVWIER
ncbi:MAG: ABC transporter substrate-binding protein [Ectothiorhodospiraceae bacterium]|nr:ABC transporter substrate-binding protein [Ectothiorhodospiraceae bacterium]